MDTAGTKMELKGFLRVIQKSSSLPSGNTILFYKKCAVFLLDTSRKAGLITGDDVLQLIVLMVSYEETGFTSELAR